MDRIGVARHAGIVTYQAPFELNRAARAGKKISISAPCLGSGLPGSTRVWGAQNRPPKRFFGVITVELPVAKVSLRETVPRRTCSRPTLASPQRPHTPTCTCLTSDTLPLGTKTFRYRNTSPHFTSDTLRSELKLAASNVLFTRSPRA